MYKENRHQEEERTGVSVDVASQLSDARYLSHDQTISQANIVGMLQVVIS